MQLNSNQLTLRIFTYY